ncbi:MAG: AI-2E family transporter [Oscillospiraceae bacterium]
MKYRWDKKYLYWGLTAFSVIVLSISFFIIAFNYDQAFKACGKLLDVLMPFIVGLSMAYLLCPVMNFFEKKWFKPLFKKAKKETKIPRVLSITLTIALTLTVITGLLFLVIPQIVESIKNIVYNMPDYFKNFENWVMKLASSNESIETFLNEKFANINVEASNWLKSNVLPRLDKIITGVTSGLWGFLVFLKNFFIGIVLSVYLLYSKEQFVAQAKKLLFSIFSIKFANKAISVTRRSHRVFSGFITGKLIDSLIIGCMCFVGMTIFKMPFALLISVIIGITNIIPFFGPLIGAIPCGLLMLMVDPLKCLYFVIFVFILQQFDGNILGPKILGDSIGLSAFWVIFAIITIGSLFGFVGMLIGVPAFAVIYSLIVEATENRLKKKQLVTATKSFDGLDYIVPDDLTPIYNEDGETQSKSNPQTDQSQTDQSQTEQSQTDQSQTNQSSTGTKVKSHKK